MSDAGSPSLRAASEMVPAQLCVAGLLSDLLFESRIRSAVEAAGQTFHACRTLAALETVLNARSPWLLVVDAEVPAVDWVAAVQMAANRKPRAPEVVVYYPHVRGELASRASGAGAHLVVPRSKFYQTLDGLLGQNQQ